MAEPGQYDGVDIVAREPLYRGFYSLDRVRLRHRQFKGGMGPEISRELFVRHDAVCVLPYDPVLDRVVLIEQFRVGALGKTDNPWLIELVAGLIDKQGEDPEGVARREAVEEAGLDLGELWPVLGYFPSPGGSNEFVHLYVARCDSSVAGGVHGLAEEGEDIRVSTRTLDEALQLVHTGRINNAPCIITLQWLALHRAEVRAKWA